MIAERRTARPSDALDGSEPFLLIRFILRRGWLLLVAVTTGVVAGVALAPRAPLYQSSAVVIGVHTTVEAGAFSSLASTVIQTPAVLQPVISELGLDVASPQSLIESGGIIERGGIEVQPVRDAVAVTIIGRARDPKLSSDLAVSAARSLAATLERQGLGEFNVLSPPSSILLAPPTRQVAAVGAAAGFLVGISVLLVVWVVRRPIQTEREADRVFPTDVGLRAQVRFKRSNGQRHVEIRPRGIVHALSISMFDVATRGDECVFVISGRPNRKARELTRLLQRGPDFHPGNPDALPESVTSDDPSLADVISRARVVVAVVPIGTPSRALRDIDEELRVAEGSPRRIRVLVS